MSLRRGLRGGGWMHPAIAAAVGAASGAWLFGVPLARYWADPERAGQLREGVRPPGPPGKAGGGA